MPWTHTFTQDKDAEQIGLGTVTSTFTNAQGVVTFSRSDRVDTRDNQDIRQYARETLRFYNRSVIDANRAATAVGKVVDAFTAEGA